MPVWLVGGLPKLCGRSACSVRAILDARFGRDSSALNVGVSPGETLRCAESGCFPRRDCMCVEDGCSPDEGI